MNNNEIKELRKKLGLTQRQLAIKLRIDSITVSRWERGVYKPSEQAQRQLNRLANSK